MDEKQQKAPLRATIAWLSVIAVTAVYFNVLLLNRDSVQEWLTSTFERPWRAVVAWGLFGGVPLLILWSSFILRRLLRLPNRKRETT